MRIYLHDFHQFPHKSVDNNPQRHRKLSCRYFLSPQNIPYRRPRQSDDCRYTGNRFPNWRRRCSKPSCQTQRYRCSSHCLIFEYLSNCCSRGMHKFRCSLSHSEWKYSLDCCNSGMLHPRYLSVDYSRQMPRSSDCCNQ